MSPARLARFSRAARGDRHLSFRLHLWNAKLCREFYFPLQIMEVSLRNSIHQNLQNRFGANWHTERSFVTAIPQRNQDELRDCITLERAKRAGRHTIDHIVAGMSFGFWHSLLNTSMTNRLWGGDVRPMFPNMPHNLGQPDVHKKLERLRLFRNAVMHHYAIFDKAPGVEWDNIKIILGWICQPSVKLMMQVSDPKKVLSAKPSL